MENVAALGEFLEENRLNDLKSAYCWLSLQFLSGYALEWAVEKARSELSLNLDSVGLSEIMSSISPCDMGQATLITYQSAIALKLSHRWNKPAPKLAKRLEFYLNTIRIQGNLGITDEPVDLLSPPFCLAVQGGDYLRLQLSWEVLSIWLQTIVWNPTQASRRHFWGREGTDHFVSHGVPETASNTFNLNNIPFSVFHAYARCSSILRLAHTTGIIDLHSCSEHSCPEHSCPEHSCPEQSRPEVSNVSISNASNASTSVLRPLWAITAPSPIPWHLIASPPASDPSGGRHSEPMPSRTTAHALLWQIIVSLDRHIALTTFKSGQLTQARRDRKRLNEIVTLVEKLQAFEAQLCLGGSGYRASTTTDVGLILVAQTVLRYLLAPLLQPHDHQVLLPDQL